MFHRWKKIKWLLHKLHIILNGNYAEDLEFYTSISITRIMSPQTNCSVWDISKAILVFKCINCIISRNWSNSVIFNKQLYSHEFISYTYQTFSILLRKNICIYLENIYLENICMYLENIFIYLEKYEIKVFFSFITYVKKKKMKLKQ